MATRVVVVGAGIAGLSAGWELSRRGVAVTILDADRIGGKIRTSPFAGRPVDEGADAFLRRVPAGLELCGELGLADQLVSPAATNARLWNGERLVPMPSGTVMGLPVSFDALGEVLSDAGIERARREPGLAGELLVDDESVGSLVRRRYGDEVFERLVAPLLGGINAGDPDRLSVRAGLPQIAEVATRSVSLSRGLRPSAPGPVFAALPDGMGALVDALGGALTAAGATIVGHTAVDSIGWDPSSTSWSVQVRPGSAISGPDDAIDGLVLAVPAGVSARLLGSISPSTASDLAAIEYSSVVLVSLAFDRDQVPIPLDSSGFLVPHDSGRRITAASWSSSKWAHLDDGRTAILRVSLGHRNDPGAIGLDDAAIERIVADDLTMTMGITSAPTEVRISRWPDGFPQYDVGHLDRIARIETAIGDDPAIGPLALTGAAFEGVGIPACIRHARRVAGRLADRLAR